MFRLFSNKISYFKPKKNFLEIYVYKHLRISNNPKVFIKTNEPDKEHLYINNSEYIKISDSDKEKLRKVLIEAEKSRETFSVY